MEIQAITIDATKSIEIPSIAPVSNSEINTQFSDLLSTSVSGLNQSLLESDKAIENLALGKLESTHEIVIALEKAKMSLQLAVEVRNKLVESYQEITRMQI